MDMDIQVCSMHVSCVSVIGWGMFESHCFFVHINCLCTHFIFVILFQSFKSPYFHTEFMTTTRKGLVVTNSRHRMYLVARELQIKSTVDVRGMCVHTCMTTDKG